MQLQAIRTLTVRGQSQGLDRVETDLDAVSAAQLGVAKSSAVMATASETSARRQLSAAGAFERLIERNDRMIYIQRQLERDMSIVNRAHEQGAIDATRHAQAVEMLEAKYQRLANAENQAAASANRLAAANDNVRSFNSGNVAAQFQDIGITAMMGQSPLTIALQQGTQLSAALGGQGLTGVLKTLGSAFGALISPVSLLTIGVVGLTAAGIQGFTAWASANDNTRSGLDATTRALAAQAAPVDSLKGMVSDLASITDAYAAAITSTATSQSAATASIIANSEREFEAKKSLLELELKRQQAAIAVQEIELSSASRSLRDEVSNGTVGSGVSNDVAGGYSDPRIGQFVRSPAQDALLQRTLELIEASPTNDKLKEMRANLELSRIGAEGLEKALSTTFGGGVAAAVDVINEKAAKTKTEAEKAAEAYDRLYASMEDRVAKVEFEASLIGKTADEQARLRIEFELTNQAAGKIPTDKLQEWIDREIKAEKATRDQTKALKDQERMMDQLGSSAQTLFKSLAGAAGVDDNPIVTGLDAALGPLMKGDWIGAAIAGITGLFVGYIEMEKKRQEAIKAANDNRATIGGFIEKGYGREVDETAIALENYRKQADQYIKLAQTAGDAALVKRLQDAAAAYEGTLRAQQRMDKMQDRFARIQVDAIARLREQADAQQAVVDRTRDFIDSTKEFRAGLLLDDKFSPLNARGKVDEAQRQFDLLVKKAGLGDANAQARLQGGATSYLDAARGYYGSSDRYQAIFERVDNALGGVIGRAGTQLSNAERQLEATNKSLKHLGAMENGIKSLNSIMERLTRLEGEAAKQQGKDADKLQKSIDKLSTGLRIADLKKAS